ncbi:MAG: hypothetical protein U9N72_00640, partial [Bacteroidota bacterium]|nr:hypothetical protein [Bacteroidota bacterium]
MAIAYFSTKKDEIDKRWIKASIAGSMWAASEIVIGSFLHNLRVPFSGNILTAIGIILLISISYKWNEKGLFWRAGLICALMKTLSPSAVIFGPMIAILSEAFLIEFSVSLLGRNYVGYISGAILAMSWSLFQRVLTLVIFYGTSIIEVYTDLAGMAEKQTGIEADLAWLPILLLLIIDAIVCILTALAGIRLGRKIVQKPDVKIINGQSSEFTKRFNDPGHKFPYSIPWLFFNLILLIGSMLVLNYLDWFKWSILIPLVITIWSVRYKRALRQLMNPKFWILFVLVTLLTSFVFTRGQAGEGALWIGLKEGLRMNFRAAVIIIGLSVTGTELYNPVIRNFFARSSYRNLPLALELSAESLPLFIRSIPGFKTILKNPVTALHNVVAQATYRLQQLENKKISSRKVLILTGGKGEGKTTFARELKEKLSENNIEVRG